MKIEDIIKVLWRRKFYLLFPMFIVPIFSAIISTMLTKEYQSESVVFINESSFKHPILHEYGLKIDLEKRLPAIKKLMKGDESLLYILGWPKTGKITNEYLKKLARNKDLIIVELKGPGVARLSFSGRDPQRVKKVVERISEVYIKYALHPYLGVGEKLKEKLKKRDEVLSVQLIPKMIAAKVKYLEFSKIYTDASPDLVTAKYEYFSWKEKTRLRESLIEQKATEILPLIDNNPDTSQLATIVEPPTTPLIPVKPNKMKIVLLAILSGISLGFILVLSLEFLDHSLKEDADIESYLRLPVIGRIPNIMIKEGVKE